MKSLPASLGAWALFGALLATSMAACGGPHASVNLGDAPRSPIAAVIADHWMEPSSLLATEIARLLPSYGPVSSAQAESLGFKCGGAPVRCSYVQEISRHIDGLPSGGGSMPDAKITIQVQLLPEKGASSLEVVVSQQPI